MALSRFFAVLIMLLLSLLVIAAAGDGGYGYGPKPKVDKPYSEGKEKLLPTIMGIQGLVYCKSGPKLIPLEGAVARITCLAVDENGYEKAPFSIMSEASDKKGYFFATWSPSDELEDNWKLAECKAFLEDSPLETCKVPTDVNEGISGAPLASYRLLNHNNMNLYSVGPFFYTSQPGPNSNGY
ncbi:hypothetical protein L1049_005490 [Liquidambar formosana]|uniref:Proline-rich protein 3-like n=1 Tax=Liquidambar formosana TaxID=63359 RepID=A0AAP0RQ24_LIQFO